ncbi:FlgO family outer membrane protein [Paraglaciecola aestuariivivens]
MLNIDCKKYLGLACLSLFSLSCSQTSDWEDDTQVLSAQEPAPYYNSNSLHWHVEKLTRQLLNTSATFNTARPVAVGTILPSHPMDGEPLPQHLALGSQIQQSLMTFATQAGLKVIEYKTMPSIKINQQGDAMLSRNIDELNTNIAAHYFLTGTYTLQENSTLVNLRLIQVPDNIVLAAATDYVPNDVMWRGAKVTLQNNYIYRKAN